MTFPIGNSPFMNAPVFFRRMNGSEFAIQQYGETAGEKYYGTYFLGEPILVVKDPDLAKRILVKDFDDFVDRMGDTNHIQRPLPGLKKGAVWSDQAWVLQIASMRGNHWRDTRATFSPIFTSAKLRSMHPLIRRICGEMVDYVGGFDGRMIELKESMGRFSMAGIAACAFGVNSRSFDAIPSPFAAHAHSIFSRSFSDMLKFSFAGLPLGPEILGFFNISAFKGEETAFFCNSLLRIMRERKGKASADRNDLVDMMLEALTQDANDDDDDVVDVNDDIFDRDAKLNHKLSRKKEFDEMEVVATALAFLVAGYHTTGSTLAYAAFELAKNRDIQERLRAEIDDAFDDEDDDAFPTYNALMALEYLDMVIKETLRRHPAVAMVQRIANNDYEFNEKITIKKGDEVFVNLSGMHFDPNFYPDPYKFNPEHFSAENATRRSPYTFAPFGHGPRSCIGMRFALFEAKMALAALVRNFELFECEKSVAEIRRDPKSPFGAALDDLYIKVERRNLN